MTSFYAANNALRCTTLVNSRRCPRYSSPSSQTACRCFSRHCSPFFLPFPCFAAIRPKTYILGLIEGVTASHRWHLAAHAIRYVTLELGFHPLTFPQQFCFSFFPPSIPPSFPRSLPPSLLLSIPRSLACSLAPFLARSLPSSLPPFLPPSLPRSLPRSLPPSLPRSLFLPSFLFLLSFFLPFKLSPSSLFISWGHASGDTAAWIPAPRPTIVTAVRQRWSRFIIIIS